MTDRAVCFGPHGRLVGILTEPSSPVLADPGTPAVLLWNVGINHHVGPYRFNVDLARQLAMRGVTSLRFDLSGRGDSEVRRDALGEIERALDDLHEAAALLARRSGQHRLIPVGFCSSVDAAHRFALNDDRVVGVCFIEGYAYRTSGFYLRYPLRLFERARWRRALAHRMPDRLRDAPFFRRLGSIPLAIAADDVVYVREYPRPEQLRHDLDVIARRGTRMLFVYAGKDSNYVYERQLFEFAGTPSLHDRVEIEYLPGADHTFFLPSQRAQVVSRICAWVGHAFGTPQERASVAERPARAYSDQQ